VIKFIHQCKKFENETNRIGKITNVVSCLFIIMGLCAVERLREIAVQKDV
jgi:hypothetical protein